MEEQDGECQHLWRGLTVLNGDLNQVKCSKCDAQAPLIEKTYGGFILRVNDEHMVEGWWMDIIKRVLADGR